MFDRSAFMGFLKSQEQVFHGYGALKASHYYYEDEVRNGFAGLIGQLLGNGARPSFWSHRRAQGHQHLIERFLPESRDSVLETVMDLGAWSWLEPAPRLAFIPDAQDKPDAVEALNVS